MNPRHNGLASLQQDFHAWLVDPTDSVARRLGPVARLAVYQNNYRAQLVGCLQQTFPQVRRWLGDEAFLAAAVRDIAGRPPHGWTLDAYGDGFPAALAAAYPDNPDLHELAWIEHALQDAFVAADAASLAPARWAEVDWQRACLVFTPSLRLRPATTNADSLWSALDAGVPVPDSAMLDEPGGLLVWRCGHQCVLRRLDSLEYAALQLVREDGSFAGLCDWLAARLGEEEGVRHAGGYLGQWLADELIISVEGDQNE